MDEKDHQAMQLQTLLRQSVSSYRKIFQTGHELLELLAGGDFDAFSELSGNIESEQEKVKLIDKRIDDLVGQSPDFSDFTDFAERRRLMEDVVGQNALLSEKIRGKMSVLSAELSQVRNGRVAMTGYGAGRNVKGGKLNRGY